MYGWHSVIYTALHLLGRRSWKFQHFRTFSFDAEVADLQPIALSMAHSKLYPGQRICLSGMTCLAFVHR